MKHPKLCVHSEGALAWLTEDCFLLKSYLGLSIETLLLQAHTFEEEKIWWVTISQLYFIY